MDDAVFILHKVTAILRAMTTPTGTTKMKTNLEEDIESLSGWVSGSSAVRKDKTGLWGSPPTLTDQTFRLSDFLCYTPCCATLGFVSKTCCWLFCIGYRI